MEREEIQKVVSYFEYSEEDRDLLRGLAPLLKSHADAMVASFYRHLLSFPETRGLLRDPAVKERLLVKQRDYLLSLAGPEVDETYVAERRRIGQVHAALGLEPRWYLGAYALYFSMLTPLVCELYSSEVAVAERAVAALNRLLLFDANQAMAAYIESHEHQLRYANEELSTLGRQLARQVEDQGGELRRASERVRAAERLASVGTLVAGLAHEIGTPMGVIQGHARLLEPAVQGEDAKWRLKTIQQQIGRISRIIESLLNMARPARIKRVPVAIDATLDTTLAFLSEKLDRRQIRVERSYEAVSGLVGDPERLQQLFLNLFINAADAMPDGGVLRVSLSPGDDGTVDIRVADTGAGIREADLGSVFDPFVTTKPAGEGSGLGLAVAQGIVAEHGGEIGVTSEVGVGTEFRIELPAA